MEKDLKNVKNRELKKKKDSIKLKEGKIQEGKNSRREKFKEGKIQRGKNSRRKKFGEGFKEREKSKTKKIKSFIKLEEGKIWRRI